MFRLLFFFFLLLLATFGAFLSGWVCCTKKREAVAVVLLLLHAVYRPIMPCVYRRGGTVQSQCLVWLGSEWYHDINYSGGVIR